MGAFTACFIWSKQKLDSNHELSALSKYINYYHKYTLECMFVIVLNLKNQTSVQAHKYSFKVKQRRDFRLNVHFL